MKIQAPITQYNISIVIESLVVKKLLQDRVFTNIEKATDL